MTHLDAQHVNRTGIMIRGLIILLCAGIINATSVFITPLAAYYGWEASAIANIGTTMLTFWPIGSIVGGKLLQKFGGKAVTLIGAIVRAKPAAAKGTYVRSLYISATMGPAVKVNPLKF